MDNDRIIKLLAQIHAYDDGLDEYSDDDFDYESEMSLLDCIEDEEQIIRNAADKLKKVIPPPGSKMAKYRTSMCHRLKKPNGWSMGKRWFFAHSINELRDEFDPIPVEIK